jgi:hypothetical protein
MKPVFQDLPDWRDADAYRELLLLERSGFAWEWLRRDPAYRDAALAALEAGRAAILAGPRNAEPAAAPWGLHAFENPVRSAPAARPMWRAGVHPFVLEASARPVRRPSDDLFDLSRFARLATLVRGGGGAEYLLLSDGTRSLRLDIIGSSLASGPVRLDYRLAGFSGLEPRLLVLRRLLALWARGTLAGPLYPFWPRAGRHVLLLRAHDALAAGASQREIAAILLSREARQERWRVEAPTLRSRVQRLVRGARGLGGDGYLSLLGA